MFFLKDTVFGRITTYNYKISEMRLSNSRKNQK